MVDKEERREKGNVRESMTDLRGVGGRKKHQKKILRFIVMDPMFFLPVSSIPPNFSRLVHSRCSQLRP